LSMKHTTCCKFTAMSCAHLLKHENGSTTHSYSNVTICMHTCIGGTTANYLKYETEHSEANECLATVVSIAIS
jgi:hypothetical protein